MMTEDKPDWANVETSDLGDGLHFSRRKTVRGQALYITVNGNTSTAVETFMKTNPPPLEVALIAIQESKIHEDGVNDAVGRYRRLGWEASIIPCIGQGPTASCGVALLARPGISVAPVTTRTAGSHIPRSPRFGLWLVEGGFLGGHIVVSLYLQGSSGLGEVNIAILE